MNLAVLDLDGTLTDTNEVDGECFAEACRLHGIDIASKVWSDFENVTDRGICASLCRLHFPSEQQAHSYAEIQSTFLHLLERAADERVHSFRTVPGVEELLASFVDGRWRAVIATGAWKQSALIKMRAAGLPLTFALCSCDDSESREEIVRSAIALAHEVYDTPTFERTVLVGDALWDLRAASALGMPFVGRAAGRRGKRLRDAGASVVVADFRNLHLVREALEGAQVPGAISAI